MIEIAQTSRRARMPSLLLDALMRHAGYCLDPMSTRRRTAFDLPTLAAVLTGVSDQRDGRSVDIRPGGDSCRCASLALGVSLCGCQAAAGVWMGSGCR